MSDDQESWTETTVLSAAYDQLDNRFELRVGQAAERPFVKVVTTPLNLTPVGAIRVADVQAYAVLSQDRGSSLTSVTQNADLGLSWRVSDRTRLSYDLAYQSTETEEFDDRRVGLSNSVALTHRFDEVFSSTARVLEVDTWEQGAHDKTIYNYSAQVVGRYLPTLQQSLTYSGGQAREPEGNSSSNSVTLRTGAKMYPGWDATFDQGYSWQSLIEGGNASSVFLRLQNQLEPHRRFSLLADYSVRWSEGATQGSNRSQYALFRALWVPVDSVSLSGETRFQELEAEWKTSWQYSAGWLPLRDGTVQLNLRYGEEVNAEGDRIRSFSPSLTWELTHYATLTLLYTRGRSEEESQMNDFQTAQANFIVYYD
ncbi:MAG: hypothetical protein IH608_05340 [Proteobacteria bacterium]|nr:hypothetical protein [Pseudomonadota bacterium]